MEQESELELEDFIMWDTAYSRFACVFHPEENRKTVEQFIDITEEEQDRLFEEFEKASIKTSKRNNNDEERAGEESKYVASRLFQQVDKRVRKWLFRYYESEFFQNVDQQIADFITSPHNYNGALVYDLDHPFHRLICHGVCHFYSLKCYSKDHRMVIINRASHSVIPSSTTLTQYLKHHQQTPKKPVNNSSSQAVSCKA